MNCFPVNRNASAESAKNIDFEFLHSKSQEKICSIITILHFFYVNLVQFLFYFGSLLTVQSVCGYIIDVVCRPGISGY